MRSVVCDCGQEHRFKAISPGEVYYCSFCGAEVRRPFYEDPQDLLEEALDKVRKDHLAPFCTEDLIKEVLRRIKE